MSRAYTISSCDPERSSSYRSSIHPLVTMVLSGGFFIASVTAVIVATLLMGREGLRLRPPQLSWPLVSTYFGGMLLTLTLHLALVGWIRSWRPWVTDIQVWRRMLQPLLGIALACMLPLLLTVHNVQQTVVLVSMAAMMVLGLLPTFICLADFIQFLAASRQEQVHLRPLASSELPASVRTWFDENTPKLIRQGFRQLRDYRLKQYSQCYARYFLSANSDTFAEISHVRMLLARVQCVSYFSLTPDGYYLESSNLSYLGKRKAIANFEAQRMPGRPLNEIYQLHVDRLKQLQKGKPRTLRVEELELVIHYGNKRLYEMLIEQQLATVNPYADIDDTGMMPQGSTNKVVTESTEPTVRIPAAVVPTWDTAASVEVPVA